MREVITIRGRWTMGIYSCLLSHTEIKKTASWGKTIGYGCAAVGGLALGAVCIFKLDPQRYGLLAVLGVSATIIYAPKLIENINTLFFAGYQLSQRAEAGFHQYSLGDGETAITLDPEAVSCITGSEEWKLRWAAFNSYQKNTDFIWLNGDNQQITIPRAWVPDDATWQSIITLIDEKISTPSSPSPTP